MIKEREKRRKVKPTPQRTESAITEHSSTVASEAGRGQERGDGGLPSDTIVEQADPFDRIANASGEETDESRNGASDMSKGGSTKGRPVKRQDHTETSSPSTNRQDRETAEEEKSTHRLERKVSPGSSTLAEREEERVRQHDQDYDDKMAKGRNEIENDSRRASEDNMDDDDFDYTREDEDQQSAAGESTSSSGSSSAQIGGPMNQNKEDWQEDMNADGGPPIRNYWGTIRYALREPMAEFLGTMILVVLGVGGE